MEAILQNFKYNEHNWKICCDLKVVAVLSGLQAGYIGYMCFLCDWHTRFDKSRISRKDSVHGNANVIRDPLVPGQNILLPPLHIKLGLVKSFIKRVVELNVNVLPRLKLIFPGISDSD